MLTRGSFARIPSPIPRCPQPARLMLACRSDVGLRLFRTGSAATLPVSRLAQCSCSLGSACSLIPPQRDLLAQRLRPRPSPARAAPGVSGWSISCRVGYPPPTGSARPFHGARESRVNVQLPDCRDPLLVGHLEAEADELWSFVDKKADKQWLWLALDVRSHQVLLFMSPIAVEKARGSYKTSSRRPIVSTPRFTRMLIRP